MGNGGIIPTSKTQTVTFFNTTGLIERGKNMYFAPRLSKTLATAGQKLSIAYLNEFKRVCPPFSDYSDMDISGWSPEDRTLVINGNIDDFRLITEVGNCLNYLIITRQVTTNNTTKTYYYSFFITGVNQVGKNSVRVTIEPDDLTNVFYLHNEHVLSALDISGDYEPFNSKMKNCYVNRQHYNRVKNVAGMGYKLKCTIYPASVFSINDGDQIELNFRSSGEFVQISGEIISHQWISEQSPYTLLLEVGYFQEEQEILSPDNVSYLEYNGDSIDFDFLLSGIQWIYVPARVEFDNLNIFLNQDESFKFKYQYKDLRTEMILDSGNITTDNLKNINEATAYSQLSLQEKRILLSSCLSYYVVETKSLDSVKDVLYEAFGGNPVAYTRIISSELINKFVRRTSPLLVIPFIDLPKQYVGLSPKIIYQFNFTNKTNLMKLDWENAKSLLDSLIGALHKNNMDEDILNVYIVKGQVFNKFINIDISTQEITFEFDFDWSLVGQTTPAVKNINPQENKAYFVGLLSNKSIANPYLEVFESTDPDRPNEFAYNPDNGAIPALMFSGELVSEITLTISGREIPDLKTNYYDNVLESEPYTFYSLSYQCNEMVLNRSRYYQTDSVKLLHSLAFNGQLVINCLPTYNINGYEIPYINESFTVTTSEVTPLVSDKFLSYYYQNMAQMKNQFAVNNYNRGTDLLQHFFLSGPANVGKGFVKGGKAGGVSALIGEATDMSNEAIDWAQSDKVIDMNQKAKLADMGRAPDTLSQSGTDIYSSILKKEYSVKLNHYTIDTVSYNSIAKYLERFGYNVSLYSTLNTMNRVGYNFVQLTSFDWVIDSTNKVMVSQQESIKSIFQEGVTLVHDKSYLTSGHNYETILE